MPLPREGAKTKSASPKCINTAYNRAAFFSIVVEEWEKGKTEFEICVVYKAAADMEAVKVNVEV